MKKQIVLLLSCLLVFPFSGLRAEGKLIDQLRSDHVTVPNILEFKWGPHSSDASEKAHPLSSLLMKDEKKGGKEWIVVGAVVVAVVAIVVVASSHKGGGGGMGGGGSGGY